MVLMKSALYLLTFVASMFFAFWEMKIKQQLTDAAMPDDERISGMDIWNDLRRRMTRERILTNLPPKMLTKYRTVVALKFFCVVVLIVEVIVLNR